MREHRARTGSAAPAVDLLDDQRPARVALAEVGVDAAQAGGRARAPRTARAERPVGQPADQQVRSGRPAPGDRPRPARLARADQQRHLGHAGRAGSRRWPADSPPVTSRARAVERQGSDAITATRHGSGRPGGSAPRVRAPRRPRWRPPGAAACRRGEVGPVDHQAGVEQVPERQAGVGRQRAEAGAVAQVAQQRPDAGVSGSTTPRRVDADLEVRVVAAVRRAGRGAGPDARSAGRASVVRVRSSRRRSTPWRHAATARPAAGRTLHRRSRDRGDPGTRDDGAARPRSGDAVASRVGVLRPCRGCG